MLVLIYSVAGILIPDVTQTAADIFFDKNKEIVITHEYLYGGAVAGFILAALFAFTCLKIKEMSVNLGLCIVWVFAIIAGVGLTTVDVKTLRDRHLSEMEMLSKSVCSNGSIGSIVDSKDDYARMNYVFPSTIISEQDTTAQYVIGDRTGRMITGYGVVAQTTHFLLYKKEVEAR
jgi:hypothetical protein